MSIRCRREMLAAVTAPFNAAWRPAGRGHGGCSLNRARRSGRRACAMKMTCCPAQGGSGVGWVIVSFMLRRLFMLASALSLLLCVATVVLWAARLDRPRVGDGWLYDGNRYTLSLSPRAVTLLGPPRGSADPAARQVLQELADDLREDNGALRFDGYTYTQYGVDFHADRAGQALKKQPRGTCEAAARLLLSALENPSLCVKGARVLAATPAFRTVVVGRQLRLHSPL
jgi:hypothetical protein